MAPVASATTGAAGQFSFSHVGAGKFRVRGHGVQLRARVRRRRCRRPPGWAANRLTPTASLSQTEQALLSVPLVDISMIIAYLWIWAGFTMVVVGAGLAALDRQALEAARVDGATEWQTLAAWSPSRCWPRCSLS